MALIKIVNTKLPLPIKTPFKIALLSDFHVTKTSSPILAECVDVLNKNPADIICLLGDYVQNLNNLSLLSIFSEIENQNIFAILDNHDFDISFPWQKPNHERAATIEEFLNTIQIRVLRNQKTTLKINHQEISIAGIDDLWVNQRPQKFFGQTTILLSHNPDAILHKISSTSQLILSGHTHGGIVNFFPVKQLFCLAGCRVGIKKPRGLFTYQNRQVYITSGVGKANGILRVGIESEIVFLTLTPTNAAHL